MKRAGSPRTNKTVTFALDENDKPIPTETLKESKSRSRFPTQRKLCPEQERGPSIDQQLSRSLPARIGKHFKDFTLYPSPSPSPKIAPVPHVCDISDEEFRMKARQRELESEIAELTRRTIAREEMNRETMRKRAVDVEALLRDRKSRSITFDNTGFQGKPRKLLARRFSQDGSVDLSVSAFPSDHEPEDLETVESTKMTEREIVTFPSPLPSPTISSTYTMTKVTHTHSRQSSPVRSRSHSPVAHRQIPHAPPFSSFRLFALKDLERSRSRERSTSHSRDVSPSGSLDSVSAVVGEREEEDDDQDLDSIREGIQESTNVEISIKIHEDEHMQDLEVTPEDDMSQLPPQCERCGLFGHGIVECQTLAITPSMRRKRGRDSEREKESEERPRKGIRHLRWIPFRINNNQ